MKIPTCLCFAATLCTLLTQCAIQPVEPKVPATKERFTDTTTHHAGKTYNRRETFMSDKTGDSRIAVTER